MNGLSYDLDKIKMGMLVAFESNGSFFSKRVEGYQEYLGFDVEDSIITHVGISMGGPYVIEAKQPKSTTSDILQDHQGRKLRFLYYRGDDFREGKRKNVAAWAASMCNMGYGWKCLPGYYANTILPIWGSNPLGIHVNPVCGYLAIWAFRRMGIDPCPGVATSMITPAHMSASPSFEECNVLIDEPLQ